MSRGTHVPITPAVLFWAIGESGYSREEICNTIGCTPEDLKSWLENRTQPTLTHVRKLATMLKRTPATFLLPKQPETKPVRAEFRHPPGSDRTTPNADERRYLREVGRVQDAASWILSQLGEIPPSIHNFAIGSAVEPIARQVRQELLRVAPSPVESWSSDSRAFSAWRTALEASGVLVFLLPLGERSVPGFSVDDEMVPAIAVSTAWNHAARIFTLLHEYGHILTRTASICVQATGLRLTNSTDPAERWCEEFAAATLLPWDNVEAFLKRRFQWQPGEIVDDLDVTKAVATAFKVSWRAATIQLIRHSAAKWDLYSQIPPLADRKRRGGRAVGGRDRGVIRRDQYGHRTLDLFGRALDRDILSRGDVLDYLDVPDTALDRLRAPSTT